MPAAKSKAQRAKKKVSSAEVKRKAKEKERQKKIAARRKVVIAAAERASLMFPGFKSGVDYGELLRRSAGTIGRPRIFDTPEQMLIAVAEYIDHYKDNPMLESKLVSYMGDSVLESVPKMRMMTMTSMYAFTGMNAESWGDYKKNPLFTDTCKAVENIIKSSKLEGAGADLLNSSIVAMEMGLAAKRAGDDPGNDDPPEAILPNFTVRPAVDEVLVTRGSGDKAKRL